VKLVPWQRGDSLDGIRSAPHRRWRRCSSIKHGEIFSLLAPCRFQLTRMRLTTILAPARLSLVLDLEEPKTDPPPARVVRHSRSDSRAVDRESPLVRTADPRRASCPRLGVSSPRRQSAASTIGTVARRSRRPTSPLVHPVGQRDVRRSQLLSYAAFRERPHSPQLESSRPRRQHGRPTTQRGSNQAQIDFVIATTA
jgi:hypothetical protein